MDWINLHIPSVIRSPAFIGSSPAERGTWLCVLSYACEIECGGRLIGAATWKDRQWQQACGVTLREVRTAWKLLAVAGDDIVVNGYPSEKERAVRQARGAGSAGAMIRWGKTPPAGTAVPIADGIATGNGGSMATPMANGHAEGEGEGEGEGKGAPALADEDRNDLTKPTPTKRIPPETHLRTLRAIGLWIKDDEERAVAIEAIGEYGGAAMVARARAIKHGRPEGRIFLSELTVGATAKPVAAASINGESQREAIAARLVDRVGWESCAAAADIPRERIGSAATMVEAMRDPDIFARVVTNVGEAP